LQLFFLCAHPSLTAASAVALTLRAVGGLTTQHADAPRAEETDWVQIVGWYDELLRLTASPVVQLNRTAPNLAERHHLTRQAARINQLLCR
jgi:predicted RNA polymerase sigma factor